MSGQSGKRVFISYRRKGGIDTARWIHDQLKARNYDVFLDMEALRAGAFDENLRNEIKNSDIFLVVLTKNSLKRCIWRSDWVRQEISCALRCGIPIIPIMKEDFMFPDRLPAEIEPLRFQNGLKISYDFFDAFMEKLEEYIVCAPKKPVHYDLPEPTAHPNWQKYAIAALPVLGAVLTVLALARGCNVDVDPNTTTDPSSQTTTESPSPSTTEATEGESMCVQVLGNSPGNQCNNGIAAADGKLDGTVSYWKFISTVDDWKYWYDEYYHAIYAQHGEEEKFSVIALPYLDYMLVTTDHIYYTLTDGDRALYRMPRTEGKADSQAAECLTGGISAHNNVFIDGDFAYYWRGGVGLFRYSFADRTELQLLEHESTMTIDTMGMFNGCIYLYTDTEIMRVKAATGELEPFFTLDDSFGDFKIVTGNAGEEWIYFAVTDQEVSGYTHADRIYRIYADGSALELLYIKDSIGCKITDIAISGTEDMFISMKCDDKDSHCLYFIRRDTGHFNGSAYYHREGFPHVVGINDGNSVTNLCNNAFVAVQSKQSTVFTVSASYLHYNWLAVNDTSYYYDAVKRDIVTMWRNGDESLRTAVKKGVDCHYLYVTPDWFFCALEENGVCTLYRAVNDPENHRIGELEVVDTGIAAESNKIAIIDGDIYYWKQDEGLFTVRMEGGTPWLRYSKGSAAHCSGCKTFYVSDEELFFISRTAGIFAVSLSDGELSHVMDNRNNSGGIAMAVAEGEKIYCVVNYITDGVRTAPDEIWSMNQDGSEITVIHKMDRIDQQILMINTNETELYFRMQENGQECIYKLPHKGGELQLIHTLS